ncbi:hypothetical protein CIL06_22915 [Pantoea vagans]|uniref:hypothetical protein n=1 Tax=Pantoea TaxID=53335 RepID=UPI000BAC5BBF|nr:MULTISPECIES: hypothetical protein [Pantoea]PAW31235.1 hypothetical protein CIL06_22915 [Pantoea vagans]WLO87245.1 hypothetical protein NHB29_22355 [Pantoea agglomerans]
MTKHNQREQQIRLCALQLCYRRAWQAQVSSCRLAAILTEIDTVRQRLTAGSPGTDAVPGSGDVTRSSA